MSNETILETLDGKRFAPAANAAPAAEVEVDKELEASLASIPDKMAFKIGEVADLVSVKPYVLRYWEGEFEALKPKKSKNNQRIYQRKDVELVMMIKKLLYRDRFSIEGARTALKALKKDKKKTQVIRGVADQVEGLREKTEDLLTDLGQLKQMFR